jgi:hypothetical protein
MTIQQNQIYIVLYKFYILVISPELLKSEICSKILESLVVFIIIIYFVKLLFHVNCVLNIYIIKNIIGEKLYFLKFNIYESR